MLEKMICILKNCFCRMLNKNVFVLFCHFAYRNIICLRIFDLEWYFLQTLIKCDFSISPSGNRLVVSGFVHWDTFCILWKLWRLHVLYILVVMSLLDFRKVLDEKIKPQKKIQHYVVCIASYCFAFSINYTGNKLLNLLTDFVLHVLACALVL